MDSDLLLTAGLIVFAFSIPAVINAFTHSQPPRLAFLFATLGTVLMGVAVYRKPGGYTFDEITAAVIGVIKQAFS